MMRKTHSDHHLYQSASSEVPTIKDNKDLDTQSHCDFSVETSPKLYYFNSGKSNTPSTNPRRASIKRVTQTIIKDENTYDHGFMINTSFFDGHLFEPARSSYILDYNDTPKDLNRFLQGHHLSAITSSHLDPHLFKLSFILTLSEWNIDKDILVDCFPPGENDEIIRSEIHNYKRFCFPEFNSKEKNNSTWNQDASTYIFTRTLADGKVEYGYCRRISTDSNKKTMDPTVICIVSSYAYFKLYDAMLNELTAAFAANELECNLLIQSFYSKPLPVPTAHSSGIACILNDRRIFFYVCPRDDRLNHDYFATLISFLSPGNFVYVFESMLRSKRILLFSNSLSKLTKCCSGLSLLMYPFVWPYSFASLMPSSWLRDLLDSPCPYIYGCLHEKLNDLPSSLDKETVRVDLDANTIETDLDDGFFLPLDLRQTLQASLEYIVRFRLVKLNSNLINIAVSEACLRVFIELIHRLPDFFKRLPESPMKTSSASIVSTSFQSHDSGIDVQTIVHQDLTPKTDVDDNKEENRLGYDFRSDEFLIAQPTSSYVNFLNDFIHGMIFMKFLDDYQRNDENDQLFSVFSQRLKERRRMTRDELSTNSVTRFRRTFDLLEKQMKQSGRPSNPTLSKLMKKIFE